MAVILPAQGVGDSQPKVATEQVTATGEHKQMVELAIPGGGAILIPASAANGLTVDITRVQGVVHVDDNAGSLTVDDGGGSLTVDGTVAISNPTANPETGLAKDATLTTSIGAQADAEAAGNGSLIAIVKKLRTLFGGGLPSALVSDRLKVDGSGVTQPISAASLPLPTGAALDATLTGGTTKAINRGGAKGTTTAADVTSTAEGADHQAMDVQTYHSGAAIDPRDVSDRAGRLLGVVDTELPAAGALGDGATNPTTPLIGSCPHVWNPETSTWDRDTANYHGTTGDAGTKTVTFAGATQTNRAAKGAYIWVLLGTVSGVSPTLACQLQWSPDAGTTWLVLGAVLGNLTATGQHGVIIAYPSAFTTTVGGTAQVATNAVLPRTWRINYTIGGTTPSFAITAVHVQYLR